MEMSPALDTYLDLFWLGLVLGGASQGPVWLTLVEAANVLLLGHYLVARKTS